jgi:Cdc6-like AAA superfamily ATPase
MTNATYEKVYTSDSFADMFEQFRDRYSERAQQALTGRKIDTAPVPNATTIIYLNDNGSGDVSIAGTGDFVAYFNRRSGGDRIGDARRALAKAARKAEIAEKHGVSMKTEKKVNTKKRLSVRSVRPRFAFGQVVFALLLVLSFTLLSVTSMLLDHTGAAVADVHAEVEALETVRAELLQESGDIAVVAQDEQASADALAELSLSGEDSVEIYPAQSNGIPIAALLNALADLW